MITHNGIKLYGRVEVCEETGLADSTIRMISAKHKIGRRILEIPGHPVMYTRKEIDFIMSRVDGRTTRWHKS